jgi:hypothetical protein
LFNASAAAWSKIRKKTTDDDGDGFNFNNGFVDDRLKIEADDVLRLRAVRPTECDYVSLPIDAELAALPIEWRFDILEGDIPNDRWIFAFGMSTRTNISYTDLQELCRFPTISDVDFDFLGVVTLVSSELLRIIPEPPPNDHLTTRKRYLIPNFVRSIRFSIEPYSATMAKLTIDMLPQLSESLNWTIPVDQLRRMTPMLIADLSRNLDAVARIRLRSS